MKKLRLVTAIWGLVSLLMGYSSVRASPREKSVKAPRIRQQGVFPSSDATTPQTEQAPVLFIDDSQTTFVVDALDFRRGKTNLPATLNVHISPTTNGCIILMSGDPNSTLKLSDLYVKVAGQGKRGSIGDYYGEAAGSGFQPTPASPTVVWRTSESTPRGSSFSLNFEVRNLNTYPAGSYNSRLFFTVVPQ